MTISKSVFQGESKFSFFSSTRRQHYASFFASTLGLPLVPFRRIIYKKKRNELKRFWFFEIRRWNSADYVDVSFNYSVIDS